MIDSEWRKVIRRLDDHLIQNVNNRCPELRLVKLETIEYGYVPEIEVTFDIDSGHDHKSIEPEIKKVIEQSCELLNPWVIPFPFPHEGSLNWTVKLFERNNVIDIYKKLCEDIVQPRRNMTEEEISEIEWNQFLIEFLLGYSDEYFDFSVEMSTMSISQYIKIAEERIYRLGDEFDRKQWLDDFASVDASLSESEIIFDMAVFCCRVPEVSKSFAIETADKVVHLNLKYWEKD